MLSDVRDMLCVIVGVVKTGRKRPRRQAEQTEVVEEDKRVRENQNLAVSCTDFVHAWSPPRRSEEHTSELQSHLNLVCRLLLEKKKEAFGDYTGPTPRGFSWPAKSCTAIVSTTGFHPDPYDPIVDTGQDDVSCTLLRNHTRLCT